MQAVDAIFHNGYDADDHARGDETGDSKSYFHAPSRDDPKPLGALTFAELTDSQELVTVKRGWYDSREKSE